MREQNQFRLRVRSCTRESGATQIEFLMSILIVLFTLFGVFEICLAMYTMNTLADAAREGVRYAIVHGVNNANCSGPNTGTNCSNPDAGGARVQNAVLDYAKFSLHHLTSSDVVVSYPDGSNAPPNRVSVVITYNYIPWLSVPGIHPVLHARAQGRIVN